MKNLERSIFYQSSTLNNDCVQIVITLPTFKRPKQVIDTLNSIRNLSCDLKLAVVVMENDAEGLEGANAAKHYFSSTSDIQGVVVVAHKRGNCHAYNAGWETTLELFPNFSHIAVIDDDELADACWISNLLKVATQTKAEIVGGPQIPIFDQGLDHWKFHPVFKPPYTENGTVPILYSSGNVLIARSVLQKMPRPFLDPSFNFIGGGDSDFYRRCRRQGFSFGFATDAIVRETIPSRRTEKSWLSARSLRNGAISTLIENRQHPDFFGRIKTIIKSFTLLAISPIRSFRLWRQSGSLTIGMYHTYVALGRLMAEFGWVNEQYRNPEKN